MKKVLFLASLLVMVASTAIADTVLMNRYTGYYAGYGGEFTLSGGAGSKFASNYDDSTSNLEVNPSFQSFCLETDEYVDIPGTYSFQLNTAAVEGGSGGPSPDTLSKGTAWLYSQFAKGTLAGYNYTKGTARANSADALQKTIWWLEEETKFSGWDGFLPDTFKAELQKQFGTTDYVTTARVDYSGEYGVRVLNLTASDGRHQDQLVVVPVPPSVWLLGSGLVGLFGIRRRFFG